MLESGFRRLPVSCFQYQHSFLAHRLSCAIAVGQTSNDGAGTYLICNRSPIGGTGRKYSLGSTMTVRTSWPFTLRQIEWNEEYTCDLQSFKFIGSLES